MPRARALKNNVEKKVGDHWDEKAKKGGPSEDRAQSDGPDASGATTEAVNANATK